MVDEGKQYELSCMAGAYGPLNRIPLLDGLLGPSLVHMMALGYATYARGYTCGIFQNDGKIFPQDGGQDMRNSYCKAIRSTPEGLRRCQACDCQGIRSYAGGTCSSLPESMISAINQFSVDLVVKYPDQKVSCYVCHAGLVELIRELSLRFVNGSVWETPIGAIWAGQHKFEGRAYSRDQIFQLAKDIGYKDPADLGRHYQEIGAVGLSGLQTRGEELDDIARHISDTLGLAFRHAMQLRFHKSNQHVLEILRKPLRGVDAKLPNALRDHMNQAFSTALKAVVEEIGSCSSVVCAAPPGWEEMEYVDVRIVASALGEGSQSIQNNHFFVSPIDLQHVFEQFDDLKRPQCFRRPVPDLTFFVKLHGAMGNSASPLTIMSVIPPMRSANGTLLWMLFLGREHQLLLNDWGVYPEVVEAFGRAAENVEYIENVVDLLIQNKIALSKLQERQTLLENGKRQRDRLVSNLAHQVARPIMELKGAAYKLSQGFTRETYLVFRAALVEVERGARNFANYDRLVREVERREAGMPTQTSVDALQALDKAHKRMRPLLETKGRTLKLTKRQPALPRLAGDEETLLECFLNVFHNAIKYSIGHLPVEVEVTYSKSARQVLVRVTNYGIELPQEDWKTIFEPAGRAETAKQLAIEGSGLGLYITRSLLGIFGGTICVESCERWAPLKDGTEIWRTTFLMTLDVYRR